MYMTWTRTAPSTCLRVIFSWPRLNFYLRVKCCQRACWKRQTRQMSLLILSTIQRGTKKLEAYYPRGKRGETRGSSLDNMVWRSSDPEPGAFSWSWSSEFCTHINGASQGHKQREPLPLKRHSYTQQWEIFPIRKPLFRNTGSWKMNRFHAKTTSSSLRFPSFYVD